MLFSARFLHTGHPMHMLAAIANCSFYRARSSILRWVPRWYETAKAFTRLTSLGAYPHVIEQLQPAKKSSSRKRVGDGEDSDSSRDNTGNDDDNDDHDNDDNDGRDNDGRDNDDHDSDDCDNDDSSHAASSVDEDKQTDEDECDDERRFDFQFVSLDGKVFPLDNFNRSHMLDRACFSSKTKTSGLQTLVWSMPCGIPIIVTGLFAAKLSEKRQVKLHSGWLVAVPPNVNVL